jgi:hypothetical protein
MTQLVAIFVVLGLALGVLFVAWTVLASCRVSGDVTEHERRIEALKALGWAEWCASANGDYLASSDGLDGSDCSDGSEHDDG